MATTASSSTPSGAKPHDTDPAPEAPPGTTLEVPPPRLNFADRAAVRAWLDDLAARVDDLAAVAEDQTASMADRLLGRAKARDLIADAKGRLASLITLARAGLGGAP